MDLQHSDGRVQHCRARPFAQKCANRQESNRRSGHHAHHKGNLGRLKSHAGRSPRPPRTAAAYLKRSYRNCRAKTVGAPACVCGSSDRNLTFIRTNPAITRRGRQLERPWIPQSVCDLHRYLQLLVRSYTRHVSQKHASETTPSVPDFSSEPETRDQDRNA